MNFKGLIRESEVREFSADTLDCPALPADGKRFLKEAKRHLTSYSAAFPRMQTFDENLELTSVPYASGPWYSDRRIRLIVWDGDLVVHGDLLDDDFEIFPMLIIKGSLSVRNWLRGGMPAFVCGSVTASGFIIGYYNDSALFVGGDLTASGYLPCVKPYPDLPDIVPHQIAGQMNARKFDLLNAPENDLKAAFHEEALSHDEEGVYLDAKVVIERFSAGLPIWHD